MSNEEYTKLDLAEAIVSNFKTSKKDLLIAYAMKSMGWTQSRASKMNVELLRGFCQDHLEGRQPVETLPAVAPVEQVPTFSREDIEAMEVDQRIAHRAPNIGIDDQVHRHVFHIARLRAERGPGWKRQVRAHVRNLARKGRLQRAAPGLLGRATAGLSREDITKLLVGETPSVK